MEGTLLLLPSGVYIGFPADRYADEDAIVTAKLARRDYGTRPPCDL